MTEILNNLRKDIEEMTSRYNNLTSTIKMVIDAAIDDIQVLPDFISGLENNLQNLQNVTKELKEKIMNTEQSIETLTTEIEIANSNKEDLEETENRKRQQKEDLETQISNYQDKKTALEAELQELMATVERKEREFKQFEQAAKEEIENIEQKIQTGQNKLQQAKEDNKLIVYLMDSGLLDVPEAEIVSIIAAEPNGLTLAQIKEKVSIPPVRVQPTINTLLEKVLHYDASTDSYRILETIKKDFSS